MAYKIIVKKRSTANLIRLLYYLEAEWGKKVANRFENKLEKRLDNLSKHPFTGAESEYFKNVRSILITKLNGLYYRIKEATRLYLIIPNRYFNYHFCPSRAAIRKYKISYPYAGFLLILLMQQSNAICGNTHPH